MSMTAKTRRRVFELPHEYAAALGDYLRRNDLTAPPAGVRTRAPSLRCEARGARHGEGASRRICARQPSTARRSRCRATNAATRFFVKCLTPFEMTERGFTELTATLRANDERVPERALHAVNQRLEEETRRLAHALHDEATQLLAPVYLALDALAGDLPASVLGMLTEVRALLEQVGTVAASVARTASDHSGPFRTDSSHQVLTHVADGLRELLAHDRVDHGSNLHQPPGDRAHNRTNPSYVSLDGERMKRGQTEG